MSTKKVRVPLCERCLTKNAVVKRYNTNIFLCSECFCFSVEEDVYHFCVEKHLFTPGEHIAVAISGGKDSTALAHILNTINIRHNLGIFLHLLSIDEGIVGYRDFSLDTVKTNSKDYNLPLYIVSYDELYGLTLDDVAKQTNGKNTCTYCGVMRRHAFDVGAQRIGCVKVATGHNADDVAESVVMNMLRCDLPRLSRCHSEATGIESALPRVKPFHLIPQREIVLYAHYQKLVFFSKECPYAVGAFRGHAREYLKIMESMHNSCITDIIHSAEMFEKFNADSSNPKDAIHKQKLGKCSKCGYMSSHPICMACQLLAKLVIPKKSEEGVVVGDK